MRSAGKTWSAQSLAAKRAEYARHYRSQSHPSLIQVNHVTVPDDITILTRDPSPCFACGSSGGCRHRPWMLANG